MILSAKFYWEDYVNNWEIDYHNDLYLYEKEYLAKELNISIYDISRIFYKDEIGRASCRERV